MGFTKFQQECLAEHNKLRAKHGVPSLKLSKDLNKFAQEWADKLVKTGQYMHRPDNDYGENIASKWSSAQNFDISGSEAVAMWYSEEKDYVYGQEQEDLRAGHFSQVIWAESKEIGVGKAKTKENKIIVVVNYCPAGNMLGEFPQNVPRAKK